jgi:hypothetical protein
MADYRSVNDPTCSRDCGPGRCRPAAARDSPDALMMLPLSPHPISIPTLPLTRGAPLSPCQIATIALVELIGCRHRCCGAACVRAASQCAGSNLRRGSVNAARRFALGAACGHHFFKAAPRQP